MVLTGVGAGGGGKPGAVSFATAGAQLAGVGGQASCLIVGEGLDPAGVTAIVVAIPSSPCRRVGSLPPAGRAAPGVHPTAVVEAGAALRPRRAHWPLRRDRCRCPPRRPGGGRRRAWSGRREHRRRSRLYPRVVVYPGTVLGGPGHRPRRGSARVGRLRYVTAGRRAHKFPRSDSCSRTDVRDRRQHDPRLAAPSGRPSSAWHEDRQPGADRPHVRIRDCCGRSPSPALPGRDRVILAGQAGIADHCASRPAPSSALRARCPRANHPLGRSCGARRPGR